MKLKFGDPKSIRYRDNCIEEETIKQVKDRVRCRFCGAKANHSYTVCLKDGYIGWNFDCKDDCINSLEYAETGGGYELAKTYTDLDGNDI